MSFQTIAPFVLHGIEKSNSRPLPNINDDSTGSFFLYNLENGQSSFFEMDLIMSRCYRLSSAIKATTVCPL